MASGIEPGRTGQARAVVSEANTAQALGSGSAPVYATPALVALLEEAAVNAIQPFLDAGQTSVGTRVELRHLAASPMGMAVQAQATLTAVDGRRLVFHVVAHDEVELIAEGSHERVIVDEQRFLARVREKLLRPSQA